MFRDTGYSIRLVEANRSVSWKFLLLNMLSFGLARRFSVYQYILVAEKDGEGSVSGRGREKV